MRKRELGRSGLEISPLGLGRMRMGCGYGPAGDKREMISVRLTAPIQRSRRKAICTLKTWSR
jgi:aryl-alcohol dehydrogenase-like predicted oxidoreductase